MILVLRAESQPIWAVVEFVRVDFIRHVAEACRPQRA